MEICIVDLETTHYSPNFGFIVEIGMVRLNLETGEIEELMNEIVKEEGFGEIHRGSWVFNNTGLFFDHVNQHGKSLEDLRTEIQTVLHRYPVTAFNRSFDFRFLKARNFLILKALPCPMRIARPILQVPDKTGRRTKQPSFQEAWNYYFPGTNYEVSHRAADDAKREALLIKRMYDLGHWRPEIEDI